MEKHHEMEPTTRARGGLGSLAEVGVFAAIIGALGLVAHSHMERAQAATRYADTISDLRVQMRAVEAYAVDTADYPRMSWGNLTLFGLPFNDQYAGFSTYATLTNQITTPVAYLPTLIDDPVLTEGSGNPELYTYQAVDTHSFLFDYVGAVPGEPGFVYVPLNRNEQRRFESYFGSYVLWGCGPSGPSTVSDTTIWLQYDPTNGATSNGNIFISSNSPRPTYHPPTAF